MTDKCILCDKDAIFTLFIEDSRDRGFWGGHYCKKHMHFKLKQVGSEIRNIPDSKVLSVRGISKDGKYPQKRGKKQ